MSEVIFSGSNKLLCRSSDGGVGEHPLLCRLSPADPADPSGQDEYPLLYSAGYSRISADNRYRKLISGSFTGVSSFAAARAWLASNIEADLDAEPWEAETSGSASAQYSVAYYPSTTRLTYAVSITAMRFSLPSSQQYNLLGKITSGSSTYIRVDEHRSPPCLGYEFSDSTSPYPTLAGVYALPDRITVVDGQNTYDGLHIPIDFTKQYFWLYAFIDPYSPPDADAPDSTVSSYGRIGGSIYCYS